MGRLTGLTSFEIYEDAYSWSWYAALMGLVGASCCGVVIGSQHDPWSLNWPLILMPAVVVPLPLLIPTRAVRVAAAVVLATWCWLAAGSLGMFFVPCLLLMIGAARRHDE
jgi:hypothetical protein